METHYIYDAGGNLLAEADANNQITRYYVHGAGLLAAITPGDDVYCYHYDGVGNTVAVTDSSQAVVNSYDYSPFGMILTENETFAQPFKFVGKLGVMSESNGFYYMRARYYDPQTGRFISEDPLGFDGGDVNLYVYGGNNPLLVVDPWGMKLKVPSFSQVWPNSTMAAPVADMGVPGTVYLSPRSRRQTRSSGDSLPISPVPEANKVWRYGYDSGHRITSLKNPLNTTTATNTYNSQGQVIHQSVPRQGGGNKAYNYYFSGFRNAEQDPAGNFLIYESVDLVPV